MTATEHSVWQSSDGDYTVVVERHCFEEMVRLARRHFPNEVGTALVGSYSDDGHVARITGLAPVTADSRGARTAFERGVRGLRDFLARLFRRSGGLEHYVGEWHSHPGGSAFPSSTDERNTMGVARDAGAQCAECILLIVAVDPDHADVGAWVFSRERGRVDLARLPDADPLPGPRDAPTTTK